MSGAYDFPPFSHLCAPTGNFQLKLFPPYTASLIRSATSALVKKPTAWTTSMNDNGIQLRELNEENDDGVWVWG